jgi:Fe2+ transport system protein B
MVWVIVSSFSFLYGGIYTEMIQEGLGITPGNLLQALVGAVIIGLPFFLVAYLFLSIRERTG